MLASSSERHDHEPQSTGTRHMPEMIDKTNLANHPERPQAIVLWVIGRLREAIGEPIPHDVLAWHIDNPEDDEAPKVNYLKSKMEGVSRREYLFVMIGDLVDEGLITQDTRGLSLSDDGRTVLENIKVNSNLVVS